MCGICGKVTFDNTPVSEDLIRGMCSTFGYRGPDDEGHYFLNKSNNHNGKPNIGFGHRRLSIIDLSDAAHQPMSNEDGTVWITYNGEIYNYKEMKKKLTRKGHLFKSNSDTEVIVHLYEEEGVHAVNQLNGMFAFALWDETKKLLWLCRDRLGIKPLVYCWDGEQIIFASEIKALLYDINIKKRIDDEALYLYLAFNYIPAPLTIFKGIKKLKPAHHLVVEKGQLRVEPYWDVSSSYDCDSATVSDHWDKHQISEALEDALDQAVQAQLIADVPLGAFLSGGIDSSIIVALMAKHSAKPVETFSIGYKDDRLYDETHYARDVARAYQTEHYEFKLSQQDMQAVFTSVLDTFDEPFADSSAIPTYIVSKETRQHVTVALSGDGGDELFAGYRSYLAEYWRSYYMLVPLLIRINLIQPIVDRLPESRDSIFMENIRRLKKFFRGVDGSRLERLLSLKEVFPKALRQNILLANKLCRQNSNGDPAHLHVRSLLDSGCGDRINQMLYTDLKDSLPCDMLTKVDWMSMKNSLEVRVPFLDHRVVELAFKIPGAMKLHRGKTKYILKETFAHLLPKSIQRRPKAGFEMPISRWLKTDLRFLVGEYLSQKRIEGQGIFNSKIVNDLVQDLFGNRSDTSWMVWNLIVFQHWYERYF